MDHDPRFQRSNGRPVRAAGELLVVLMQRSERSLADTTFELRAERRHLDVHGRGRAHRHLHHRRGDPRAPAGRLFKKEALETLHAESRLVPLARRRTPPRWAAARSTCWAVRSCARFRNLSKLVGHSGASLVGCAGVPGTTSRMCDIRVE